MTINFKLLTLFFLHFFANAFSHSIVQIETCPVSKIKNLTEIKEKRQEFEKIASTGIFLKKNEPSWTLIKLNKPSHSSKNKLIFIDNYCKRIDIWFPLSGDSLIHYKSGYAVPIKIRKDPIPGNAFKIPEQIDYSREIIIKIDPLFNFYPIEIVSELNFQKKKILEHTLQGWYLGGLTFFFILLLVLVQFNKNQSIKYFLALILIYIINAPFSNQQIFELFLAKFATTSKITPILRVIPFILYGLFVIHFFRLKKTFQTIYKFGILSIILFILCTLLLFFRVFNVQQFIYSYRLLMVINIVPIFIVISHSIKKGTREGNLFLGGHIFFSLAALTIWLNNYTPIQFVHDNYQTFQYLSKAFLFIAFAIFSFQFVRMTLEDKLKIQKKQLLRFQVLKKKEKINHLVNNELQRILDLKTKDLQKSLHERSILLQEIHHRTKNNLMVVTAIIDLQLESVKNDSTKQILLDTKSRINSIGILHQFLQTQKSRSVIDLHHYIPKLIDKLLAVYQGTSRKVISKTNITPIKVDLDLATPIGLIVNEVVTNCLKHAFTKQKSGIIQIDLHELTSEEMILTIKDNGKGYLVKNKKHGIGHTLVKDLTKQLSAKLTIDSSNQGTAYILKIPYNH